VLASAARASDPNLTITGQLHNYPWTGDMVEEVISCVMHPGSHPNNRQIRPGQEDPQTLASMEVLDAARSIGSTDKFKATARLGEVVVAILNRARQWSHGHDAVQQMLDGFWRQVDVYRPSADHYSRSSTVSKKFQALVPYLTVVSNTDKNIAAAMAQAGRFANLRDPWVSAGAAFASEMEHLFLHGPTDRSVIMTSRLHDTMKNID
jgi:hypothetical protein